MSSLIARLTDIQARLDALARQHQVPGAVLAVSTSDQALEFATGLANRDTGVEVTPGTVFQIGSITKLLTATLVMQLVDAGEVDLDTPVGRYLPSFALAEPGAEDKITVRQLLTHTSGIEGDHFDGFGRGDDAIERYVASLAKIGLIYQPGQMWSYCNCGFVLAGHLAEKLTGLPYHQALRERICEPLGLDRMTVRPDQMLVHRCAAGHLPTPDGGLKVSPAVVLEPALAPAGGTGATAREVAAFARMHLAGGLTPDGQRVLSASSARAMQQGTVAQPRTSTAPQTQGLGWMAADWAGQRAIGHVGGVQGQTSFLQAIPELDLIVVLLTNSSAGPKLWRDLGGWLFETLAGLQMPTVPKPADPPPDLPLDNYVGTYQRLGMCYHVALNDGQLVIRLEPSGAVAELTEDIPPLPMRPVDSQSFYLSSDGDDGLVNFTEFQDGRPGYLMLGRAARRVLA